VCAEEYCMRNSLLVAALFLSGCSTLGIGRMPSGVHCVAKAEDCPEGSVPNTKVDNGCALDGGPAVRCVIPQGPREACIAQFSESFCSNPCNVLYPPDYCRNPTCKQPNAPAYCSMY
jgi:hypothetical protein